MNHSYKPSIPELEILGEQWEQAHSARKIAMQQLVSVGERKEIVNCIKCGALMWKADSSTWQTWKDAASVQAIQSTFELKKQTMHIMWGKRPHSQKLKKWRKI